MEFREINFSRYQSENNNENGCIGFCVDIIALSLAERYCLLCFHR